MLCRVKFSRQERRTYEVVIDAESSSDLLEKANNLNGTIIRNEIKIDSLERVNRVHWDQIRETEREICCKCGESVSFGSGRFVNRFNILDNDDTKKSNGHKYFWGDYICAECDNNLREEEGE